MQLDMHYYAIYYLGLAAGLEPEKAYIIAYSSQYVDDAREHEKIQLKDKNGLRKSFDPICTQHMSLDSFGEIVADKIYYPFHFIPNTESTIADERAITRPLDENQELVRMLDAILASKNWYRIGIFLHAFADSYSHEHFSGDWSTVNEVNRLRCVLRKRVMPGNFFKSLGLIMWIYIKRFVQWVRSCCSPAIGHAKAYKLPDYPHAFWRFKDSNNYFIKRSNPDIFLRCGMKIFEYLKKLSTPDRVRLSDSAVKETVKNAVYKTGRITGRIKIWKDEIKKLGKSHNITDKVEKYMSYDPIEWKQLAFEDEMKSVEEIKPDLEFAYTVNGNFENFERSHFCQYHLAARDQRVEVLEKIKSHLPRVELSLKETKDKIIFQ